MYLQVYLVRKPNNTRTPLFFTVHILVPDHNKTGFTPSAKRILHRNIIFPETQQLIEFIEFQSLPKGEGGMDVQQLLSTSDTFFIDHIDLQKEYYRVLKSYFV